jgi:hypothetical protein
MFNQFHVLSVDEIKEEDSEMHMVPVAQPPDPINKRIKKKRDGNVSSPPGMWS